MGPKDVIRKTLDMSDFIIKSYLSDLSDADLQLRTGRRHAPDRASARPPDRSRADVRGDGQTRRSRRPCPTGSQEAHDLKNAAERRLEVFATKDEYIKLWDAQRAATKAVLETACRRRIWRILRAENCPRLLRPSAHVFNMAGVHALNHSGQFVAVRRMLKKPIAF